MPGSWPGGQRPAGWTPWAEMGLLRPSAYRRRRSARCASSTRTRAGPRHSGSGWKNSSKAPWSWSCHQWYRGWPGSRAPATCWKPSPTASATQGPGRPGRVRVQGGREGVEHALKGMLPGEHHLHADPDPPGPRHVPGPLHRRSRGRDRCRLGAIPAAWESAPTASVPEPRPRCRGADRSGAARGDPRRQPQARHGHHRRDRPGKLDEVPHRRSPGVLGWARTRRPPVRPAQRKKGQGDACLKGYCTQAANGAARTGTSCSAKRFAASASAWAGTGPSPWPAAHPDHHLAPARQPRSPVHRPRSRLARTQNRPRPQDPRSPPPAPALGLDVTVAPAVTPNPADHARSPRRHGAAEPCPRFGC